MQHAREWLAGETCRRTLEYFVDNYGKGTSAGIEVTQLVDSTELWFVCVNNPDGYEFTFTPGNRLQRKNLRDNDLNRRHQRGDGVDPNRNFRSNWGRDDDGSSPRPESDTYRGPAPASEPETTSMEALFDAIQPVFQKNDHTAAELLLYPQGFQQDTPSADHEIFTALAGDPFKPAIPGFLPELSAGPLHHQRRLHRLGLQHQGRALVHARGHRGRGRERHGLRVPRLRGCRSSRSSIATCRSRSTSRTPPTTRPSPTRTSTTRPTTSASTRSPSPTATRSPSARSSSASSAPSRCASRSTAGPTQVVPTVEYTRRRAPLQGARRLLPPRARLRRRHEARRLRRGVVHRGRPRVGALHLRGGTSRPTTRCSSSPTRTGPACSPMRPARCPGRSTSTTTRPR